MTDNRSEERAETARRNDDSAIIDAAQDEALAGEVQSGRSGGDLQRDVATQAEEERVFDPEAHEGVTKNDKIAHGEQTDEPHPPERVLTERD
jgi:hypothetical protein